MKTKTSFLYLLIILLVGSGFFMTSCIQTEDNWQATYLGVVLDSISELPFSNCAIQVTDGNNIVHKTKTDENGDFSITLNMNDINESFYFLFGSVVTGQKRMDFPGYAPQTYNLGTIYIPGPSAPIVETIEISNISSTSASIKCNVKSNGGYAISACGVCWSTNANPTIQDKHTEDGNNVGEFSSTINELLLSQRYYVRAYAINEKGTSYGTTLTFVTLDGRPIVETTDPGEKITATSITTGGQVISDEGSDVIDRGIVYGTLPYPTVEDTGKIASGSGVGYFSANITNISPINNTYYIRAYATNAKGTGYGEQIAVTPERSEYLSLPTIIYGGYKYHAYKDMGKGDWNTANQLCEDLTFAGYDDWYLPDKYELVAMIEAKIDGWYFESGYSPLYSYYWTSTKESLNYYYCYRVESDISGWGINRGTYSRDYNNDTYTYRFRAVRRDKIQ